MLSTIKNIGCLAVLIIVGIVSFVIYEATDDAAPSERVNTGTSAPERVEPLPDVVSLMFHKSCRNYMNDPDSYKPGNTRTGNHPEGYAYVHEFRGRNAFGGMIKDICGLLYSTNTHSWTFFDKDQLPELLKDVTVNGKHITEISKRSFSPRENSKQKSNASQTTTQEQTTKISTCAKCQGTGKIKTFSKCSKCGGAGRIYTNGKWQQCPKRIEQSPVTCSSCNGTGKITQLK